MKCQMLFYGKEKKTIIDLLSVSCVVNLLEFNKILF